MVLVVQTLVVLLLRLLPILQNWQTQLVVLVVLMKFQLQTDLVVGVGHL